MDDVVPYLRARQAVFWLVVVAITVVTVSSVVLTFTADPHSSEGWIEGPIVLIFMGGPLLYVAVGLRSRRRATARRTAVAAMLFALAVTFVLVMQLLDANETMQDRSVQLAGLLVYLAAVAVELPAFTDRWPPDRGRPRAPVRRATRDVGS